jgi:hypothetical protein
LQPTREGKLKVADGRGGPFDLSWEVHGKGETKLVVSGHVLGIELSKGAGRKRGETVFFAGMEEIFDERDAGLGEDND